MTLAIFDLDNTLIGGDSDYAWGEFLVEKEIVDPQAYKAANDHFYEQYLLGKLDIYEYLAFALEPLARHSKAQLDRWHAEFMADKIRPMMLPKASALLDRHRKAGDRLLIITATNSFVTRPIAEALGVSDLLATEPAFDGERYTGLVEGTPCYKAGKVTRLHAWLADQAMSLEGSYCYSDSHNDLPLLEVATHPCAVDPDETLRAHAEQAGWPIMSLRD